MQQCKQLSHTTELSRGWEFYEVQDISITMAKSSFEDETFTASASENSGTTNSFICEGIHDIQGLCRKILSDRL